MHEHEQQPEGRPDSPEHQEQPNPPPRVWIASLADYNHGDLHGEWLDAAVETEELEHRIQAMLAGSSQPGAEEWAIFDYDGFGDVRLDEHETLQTVTRVARGIVEHGLVFAAWAQLHDCEADMLEHFQDAYLGSYDSRQAFAASMVEDLDIEAMLQRHLPPSIARYVSVDLEALAQDMELSGDIHFMDHLGGVWVFDPSR